MQSTSKTPPTQGHGPIVEAHQDGDALVIRFPLPAQTDAICSTAKLALAWDLPQASLEDLARSHGLLRRIGRQNAVNVAALVRVIDAMGPRPEATPPPTTEPAGILRALVARTRRGAR